MHLSDGGGRQRRFIELRDQCFHRRLEFGFDDAARLIAGEGRHLVQQHIQRLDVFARDEIGASGKKLAELDEGGAQFFEGDPQPFRSADSFVALQTMMQGRVPPPDRRQPLELEPFDDLSQPMLQQYIDDLTKSSEIAIGATDSQQLGWPHDQKPARL